MIKIYITSQVVLEFPCPSVGERQDVAVFMEIDRCGMSRGEKLLAQFEHPSEYGVDKSRCALMDMLPDPLHRLVDGRVIRHAVQQQELRGTGEESGPHRPLESTPVPVQLRRYDRLKRVPSHEDGLLDCTCEACITSGKPGGGHRSDRKIRILLGDTGDPGMDAVARIAFARIGSRFLAGALERWSPGTAAAWSPGSSTRISLGRTSVHAFTRRRAGRRPASARLPCRFVPR